MSIGDEPSAQADGITMSGGGVYSLATKGAKDVIDIATPLVLDAFESIPADSLRSGVMMSDMGSATMYPSVVS